MVSTFFKLKRWFSKARMSSRRDAGAPEVEEDLVDKNLWKLVKQEVTSPDPELGSSKFLEGSLETCVRHRGSPIKKEPQYPVESAVEALQSLEINPQEETQATTNSASDDKSKNQGKLEEVIDKILDEARSHRNGLEELGGVGGVEFCYFRFQRVLQAKSHIIRLRRLEQLVMGKVEATGRLECGGGEDLAKIYGVLDCHSEVYDKMLKRFKAQRLEELVEMHEQERDLLGLLVKHGIKHKNCSDLVLSLELARTELESALSKIPEASMDLNPYTNPYQMDFFALPRPLHQVSAYVLQKATDQDQGHLEKDVFVKEGYNAGVYDVGCTFSGTVLSDDLKISGEMLLKMKNSIQKYPLGVEVKYFFEEFRKASGYEEALIEGCSDEDVAWKIPDVFFPQKLGNERVILFPGLLQGLIDTPKNILFRIWKKIEHLADLSGYLCVTSLEKEYEQLFDEPLYPMKWGFGSVKDLVQYCLQTFDDGLNGVGLKKGEKLEEMVKAEQDKPQSRR